MTNRLNVRTTLTALLVLASSAGTCLAQNDPSKKDTPPAAPATPAAPAAPAQPASSEKLPSAGEIFARYIEVTGGKAAYEKLKSRVSTGTFEMAGMGKAAFTLTQESPNKMAMTIDLPGMGKMVQGNNGTHAWEYSAMTGPRLLEGEELLESNGQSLFNAELYPEKVYTKTEVVGIEKVGDSDAYKVAMTTKGGSTRTAFYDKASGLLVKMTMLQKSQMGEVAIDSITSDYREVDGVKLPFKTTIKINVGPGMEQVMTIEKLTHNTEIAADAFKAPAEVQELIDAKKKNEEKKDAPKTEEPKK
jgi:hypothetical protein